MSLSKAKVQQISQEMKTALKEIAQKHGLDVNIGNIGYNCTKFSTKLTVSVLGNHGENQEADKKEFELYAPRFGIKPSAFGKTFDLSGKQATVIGIKPRAKKYPVIVETTTGKYKVNTIMLPNSLTTKETALI